MAPRKKNLKTGKKQAKVLTAEHLEKLKPTQFKPGISGNPGGRPKNIFRDALIRAISKKIAKDPNGRELLDQIADKLAAKAIKGDLAAIGMIADRTDGKPTQATEVTGRGGGPIEFMTLEQKKQRLAQLLAKAGGIKDGSSAD